MTESDALELLEEIQTMSLEREEETMHETIPAGPLDAPAREIEKALEYARDLGKERGTNAAGWWEQDAIGGRATGNTRETARRVLQGIEDGDPEILDALPYSDLSGEWADSLTGPMLVRDALEDAGIDLEELEDDARETLEADHFEEICDAYEEAFNTAAHDEIQRVCRLELEETE